MTRQEIMKIVTKAIVEQTGIEEREMNPSSSLVDDLGLSSLNLTQMIMDAEEKFGLEISQRDATTLETVNAIVDYIFERK
ncbi:MAG: acyl carrier protein [Parcubacteria group bacterium]